MATIKIVVKKYKLATLVVCSKSFRVTVNNFKSPNIWVSDFFTSKIKEALAYSLLWVIFYFPV